MLKGYNRNQSNSMKNLFQDFAIGAPIAKVLKKYS